MEEIQSNSPQSDHALAPPPPQPEHPTNQTQRHSNSQDPHPTRQINGTNCLKQCFFTWVYSLLSQAQDEDLQIKSTPSLPPHLQAEFEFWRYLEKRKDFGEMGLFRMLLSVYGSEILILVLLCMAVEVFYLSYPILIYFNIDYLQNHRSDQHYGIILFVLTIFSSFMYNFIYTNLKFRFKTLGVNISTHLNLLIYHKALNYSMNGQKGFNEGDIIGYSQIDTDNMMYVGSKLAYFIFGVIEVFAGFGLLYWFVGFAFIAGLIVLLLLSTITFLISSCSVSVTDLALQSRDQRLSATAELLSMIRFVKVNAMEKIFYKRIESKREEELNSFKKKGIIEILLVFLYYMTAPLLLTSIIVTYYIIHQSISSTQVFTTMMIAVVFEVTAQQLPKASSELLAVLRSIERINAFLQAPDIDHHNYTQKPDQTDNQYAIKIKQGNFFIRSGQKLDEAMPAREQTNNPESRQGQPNAQGPAQFKIVTNEVNLNDLIGTERRILGNNQEGMNSNQISILKDISLNIKRGKLYMIYGDIGSGKSMLLLSILNELNKKAQSNVQVFGKVAYVSQKPWVFSGTLQENIQFTFKKDEKRLHDAIKYACLQEDVQALPNGKKTEIGENGINLSGGQKFRVDLARSLYSQSDIYLYDDVLSAVDIHVGSFLMQETILGYLKGKTIVMATHAIKFASKADYIILMKEGRIVACDRYKNITKIPEFHEVEMKIMEREREKEQCDDFQEVKSIIQSIIEEQHIEQQQISASTTERPSVSQNADLVEELILPQEQEKGQVNMSIFREFIRLNGGYICFLGLIIVCFLIYSGLQTAASILLSIWSQDSATMTYLYVYISLTICANFFIFIEAVVLLLSGVKQGKEVHNNIIKGLLYASLTNFFNRVPIGRILNRLGKDLKELDEVIATTLSSFLMSFFRILAAVFICIYTSTPFALIPIAFVTVIFILIRKFYLKAQSKLIRLEKITNSPLITSFTNGIRGATSIRSYSSCQQYIQTHIELVNNYKRVLLNHFAASAWFVMALVGLGYIVNMFCIGFCMFSSNQNPAYIGLLLPYILNLNDELFYFVLGEADFETQLISLERLYHITKLAPQKRYTQYCNNWNQEEEKPTHVLTSGSIEFKHASARYRADLPKVIKNMSCKIKSGEKIGIVGRSGSGKTTILNTIIGIAELSQGDILIDGKKMSEIPLKNLRREITVIDQEPVLINSTFRENLDIFGEYNDEQLRRIMKECNIESIIESRGGLDGKVSNDTLSAGEKQLLCICRALLKNSKIVLIDQATANIDILHDQLIQQVIAEKFKDKTLLTIAHRLSTLANYDKIIVMEGGKLLEFGTPQELVQMSGLYYEMMRKHQKSVNSSILK